MPNGVDYNGEDFYGFEIYIIIPLKSGFGYKCILQLGNFKMLAANVDDTTAQEI